MNIEPINLLDKYGDNENKNRQLFERYKKKNGGIINTSIYPELKDLKAEDIIQFKNGFDVELITKILGFDSVTGYAYMLWDCYWFPVDLRKRFIKKIE